MEDYHTSYHLNKHTLQSLIKQKLLLKMIELAQDLMYSIDSRSLVSKSLIPRGKKKKKSLFIMTCKHTTIFFHSG